ncbi:MAG: amidase [Archangium sp.]|nr:amidase [Archangium sp.]
MTPNEYITHDATGLAALIATGEVTALEVLNAALAQTDRVNPRLNTLVVDLRELARTRAAGPLKGPFAGVPYLLKDLTHDLVGVPTTMGSRALASYRPTVNATVVQRALDGGLVIFGKTTLSEFAFKGTTETALTGITRNPWNEQHTPGGSSGGAAAAVAGGMVPMAAASDGGGSIRIPAAYCGLFGLKPSRGRVPYGPRRGEGWDGAAADLVISRSVRDTARMLDVLAGPTTGTPYPFARIERPFAEALAQPVKPLRIGFSTTSPIGTPVAPECVRAVEHAVALLSSLGHRVEPAAPEVDGDALAKTFLTMYFGQAAANIADAKARANATDDNFELDTRALALLGRALSAGDSVAAMRRWSHYGHALATFQETYDLYLTPTTAELPAKIGQLAAPPAQQWAMRAIIALGLGKLLLASGIIDTLARTNLRRTPFTQLANLTGTPAMSVPLHWTDGGLPVGVQFIGRLGDEATLLQLGAQLEEAQPWFKRLAPITTS